MVDVIDWTLHEFGREQASRYRQLMESALDDIMQNPVGPLSKKRPELRPANIFTHHITRRGKAARHWFIYHVDHGQNRIEIIRLLHDSMEIKSYLPDNLDILGGEPSN